MKTMCTVTRRAGLAGLLLAVSLTFAGASPSGAAEISPYTYRSLDYQYSYNFADLAGARIARVGITPIPIP